MEILFGNINIDRLQNKDDDLAKISRNNSSYGDFQSVFDGSQIPAKSKELMPLPVAMQKLQGVMFQYFIKSILPDETVKSLGGGFYGDFLKEVLAENISNAIAKQHKINFSLYSDASKQNTNFP